MINYVSQRDETVSVCENKKKYVNCVSEKKTRNLFKRNPIIIQTWQMSTESKRYVN